MADLNQQIQDLLSRIPENQRQAAGALVVQYGPQLFDLAKDDALAYVRRIMAGDLTAVADLDAKLSDDAFIAKVKANTAAWDNVAAYNKVRNDLKNEILLRIAPVAASILLALVGL